MKCSIVLELFKLEILRKMFKLSCDLDLSSDDFEISHGFRTFHFLHFLYINGIFKVQ